MTQTFSFWIIWQSWDWIEKYFHHFFGHKNDRVVYKKKCNSLQLQIFNYISSWYYISWSRPPPAKWFSVFCSWECKWCKWCHRPIVDRSAPSALSCCHKLNEIGASSSRTKRMHWNSLKILNNLFESEIKFWDLPSIHEVPKFSTCILQLHFNSTVSKILLP